MATVSMLFVIFSWTIESNVIHCDSDYECQSKNISCDDDEDCFIYCTRYRSCNQANFICPKSSNPDNHLLCQAQCGDGTSLSAETCYYTTFNAYNSHNFSLAVNAGSQRVSDGIEITCPCDGYCDIDCGTESYGCRYFDVDALHSELTVSGSGNYAFNSMKFYGSEARLLSISGSGSRAFYYADIYCPVEGDTNNELCHITYSGTDNYAFWVTNIYSVNSVYGVDLECTEFADFPCIRSSSSSLPTMHCVSNYSKSCSLNTTNGKQWSCEENSVCSVSTSNVLSNWETSSSTLCTESPTESMSIGTVLLITFCSLFGVIILSVILWCYKIKKPSKPLSEQNNINPEYHSVDSQNVSMVRNEGQ